MITKIWAFCRRPANLALLIALGGGAAWLWSEFKPAASPENKSIVAPEPASPAQNAEADNGGTAINARDNASVAITK